jgi:hypothetical protein
MSLPLKLEYDDNLMSTADLELLLNSICPEALNHKKVKDCVFCYRKALRIAFVFKKHKPKGKVIEMPNVFQLCFPKYKGNILLTHVLYGYQCVIDYINYIILQDKNEERKKSMNNVLVERKEFEERWYNEVTDDLMLIFYYEVLICHRIAMFNITSRNEDMSKVEEEYRRFLNMTTSSFVFVEEPSSLAEEYDNYYKQLSSS